MKRSLTTALAIALMSSLAAGCGSASDEDKVRDAVVGMFEAIDDGDCDAYNASVSGERDQIAYCKQSIAPTADDSKYVKIDVTNVKIQGAKASVTAAVTDEYDGDRTTETYDLELVRKGGVWRVLED